VKLIIACTSVLKCGSGAAADADFPELWLQQREIRFSLPNQKHDARVPAI